MKTKKNKRNSKNKKKTTKNIKILSKTPLTIRKVSNAIAKGLHSHSYVPTINKDLVSLYSATRDELLDCNNEKAFEFKEPLQIGLNDGNCYYYYTKEAKKLLLSSLSKNKHIDPAKIIPPIQLESNCWFNAMFVIFFVSDKGRLFFHFFRQLMIEGKQKNNTSIPTKLRDAFALLNFGIDSCLTGNKYSYQLDTNHIIHSIYKGIPDSYKKTHIYIKDVKNAGNPLLYYISIINYLNNNSLQLLFIRNVQNNWREKIEETFNEISYIPHIIVLEIYDDFAFENTQKPIQFKTHKKQANYKIDSAVVRDTSKQHFCATITCEKTEMGYDGMSFHRLVNLKWKQNINSDINWSFEGSNNYDDTPLKWNFRECYQLLIYYRVK